MRPLMQHPTAHFTGGVNQLLNQARDECVVVVGACGRDMGIAAQSLLLRAPLHCRLKLACWGHLSSLGQLNPHIADSTTSQTRQLRGESRDSCRGQS